MDSWDHPMKFPYYVEPNRLMTWNVDLAKETKNVQNLNNVSIIRPLRFDYINKYKKCLTEDLLNQLKGTKYYEELISLKENHIILYPCTTSSLGLKHSGEIKLINDLVDIFKDSKYLFYIKPKPNGAKGDYDQFNSLKNIKVGMYPNDSNAFDMLDEKYNIFRFLLLRFSKTIINAGTTFAIDAALMAKPVVQLRLNTKEYLGFDDFCNVYDVKEYILKHGGIEFGSKYKKTFH